MHERCRQAASRARRSMWSSALGPSPGTLPSSPASITCRQTKGAALGAQARRGVAVHRATSPHVSMALTWLMVRMADSYCRTICCTRACLATTSSPSRARVARACVGKSERAQGLFFPAGQRGGPTLSISSFTAPAVHLVHLPLQLRRLLLRRRQPRLLLRLLSRLLRRHPALELARRQRSCREVRPPAPSLAGLQRRGQRPLAALFPAPGAGAHVSCACSSSAARCRRRCSSSCSSCSLCSMSYSPQMAANSACGTLACKVVCGRRLRTTAQGHQALMVRLHLRCGEQQHTRERAWPHAHVRVVLHDAQHLQVVVVQRHQHAQRDAREARGPALQAHTRWRGCCRGAQLPSDGRRGVPQCTDLERWLAQPVLQALGEHGSQALHRWWGALSSSCRCRCWAASRERLLLLRASCCYVLRRHDAPCARAAFLAFFTF